MEQETKERQFAALHGHLQNTHWIPVELLVGFWTSAAAPNTLAINLEPGHSVNFIFWLFHDWIVLNGAFLWLYCLLLLLWFLAEVTSWCQSNCQFHLEKYYPILQKSSTCTHQRFEGCALQPLNPKATNKFNRVEIRWVVRCVAVLYMLLKKPNLDGTNANQCSTFVKQGLHRSTASIIVAHSAFYCSSFHI